METGLHPTMPGDMIPLTARLRPTGLAVRGVLHAPDGVPEGMVSLVLLGPDEPRFWSVFTASLEYHDGAPHPLDRWSRRVIGALAREEGGEAVFPSEGPPYAPFISWALASGQAWASPIGPLVHAKAGLFISYRGALALPYDLPSDLVAKPVCDNCARPCVSACPVRALSDTAPYDAKACLDHVSSDAGRVCRETGCLARQACPVAQGFTRLAAQSAFHMSAFMKAHRPCSD